MRTRTENFLSFRQRAISRHRSCLASSTSGLPSFLARMSKSSFESKSDGQHFRASPRNGPSTAAGRLTARQPRDVFGEVALILDNRFGGGVGHALSAAVGHPLVRFGVNDVSAA